MLCILLVPFYTAMQHVVSCYCSVNFDLTEIANNVFFTSLIDQMAVIIINLNKFLCNNSVFFVVVYFTIWAVHFLRQLRFVRKPAAILELLQTGGIRLSNKRNGTLRYPCRSSVFDLFVSPWK